MRYFTQDPKADGITDFHGATEWFDTEQRVAVLGRYADYASRFWGDPGLDRPLFTDSDVLARLARIKPQPLTSVRRTIRLEEWRAYGYKAGKENDVRTRWEKWISGGARVENGCLVLDGKTATLNIKPLDWRFRIKGRIHGESSGLKASLVSEDGETIDIQLGSLEEFEIYGDLVNQRLFLSSNGKTIKELSSGRATAFDVFSIGAPGGKASLEYIALYNFTNHQQDDPRTPYWTEMVFDEDFEEVPSMAGWQDLGYDDSSWELVKLPSPHGGFRGAGEDYYLRTKVKVGGFDSAHLMMETLDPGGEVWVNGRPAAVLSGRLPRNIDVSGYLIPDSVNTIAVKVKPFYTDATVFHAPNDHNFGWFLGRTELVLNDGCSHIAEALVHTASLDAGKAVQHHKVTLRNDSSYPWKGSLLVNYYPWFPEEGPCVASEERPVEIRPIVDNAISFDISLQSPDLWSPSSPRLYKVEVVLKDRDGNPVDDYVTTTGIRLIEQREGVLYINQKPEMLNGAQIFGYRLPLETVAVTVRCATGEMVMRELMMTKALGNLLRIHVHAENVAPSGINDPRFAEYADQLGLYIIWQTPSWIREGEVWNIDFSSYPVYMRQVYNHPSIVMWEASNHPNQFKKHDFSDSEDFMNTIIPLITGTDSSRLVSPISFWQNTHYANYEGTMDYKGGKHDPNPLLMHRMMTRGSQDSYTGYQKDWSGLRNFPYPFAKSCLDAKGLCYFNFEHEESIAQPNWELAKKEPWYQIPSYEKDYEKGSIGRLLGSDEWRASQGYQAFSAWESMKLQTLAGVCGYSWCSLESGPNMFTYHKPLVDPFYVPKLAFHANRMAFREIWAASDDADTVYGPDDSIRPVIFNMGKACEADLTVELQNERGKVLERRSFKGVEVAEGRSVTRLDPFRFRNGKEGCRFIVYKLQIK